MKKIFYILIAFIALTSCSTPYTEFEDAEVTPDVNIETSLEDGEVSFLAYPATRTAIDDIDNGSVKWVVDDKIHLWGYLGDTEKIANTQFSLRYYGSEYNEAHFTGSPKSFSDPESVEYTYYAVHPTPTAIEGSVVSYDIPINQNGRYDGSVCDPMVASGVAPAFQSGKKSKLQLSFRHMAHILRIQIPDGRYNLGGEGASAMKIEFPAAVSNGALSFDFKSGESKGFSGTSKSIMVNLDTPTKGTGNYIWVFINPQVMSGEIKFRFYNDLQHTSNTISTTVSNLNFRAGYITPLDLTVPERVPLTDIRLKVTSNNLGENPTKVTFTAPNNTMFADGTTSLTYDYIANTDYEYILEFEGPTYNSALKNQKISMVFDSPNALVGREVALGNFTDNTINRYSTSLPYILEENFSGIKSFSYHDNPGVGKWDSDAAEGKDGVSLSDSKYGSLPTSGWTANRAGASAGNAIRIMGRYEYGAGVKGHYEGRLDSPNFTLIKDGKTPNLKVTFNYKGGRYSKYNSWGWKNGGGGNATFNYGYTTNQGGQNGEDDIQHKILSSYATLPNTAGGNSTSSQNYNGITYSKSFTIPKATNKTRASWRVTSTMNNENFLGANGNFWLYIDKIKVQITK